MADCSQLSKLITQLATNIATDPNVKDLSDVVEVMKDLLPQYPITYEYVSEAIHEATTGQNKQATDLQKKLNAIRGEARGNVNIQKAIEVLDELLETGQTKNKKAKKTAPLRIEQLRETRDNLRKWLETSDPAMEKKLNQELDALNKEIASGEVTVQRRGKLHPEIQKIKDEINTLREQIRESTKESKTKDALQEKLTTLQRHLEEGTLPEPQKKTPTGGEEIQALRDLIQEVRKEVNRSAPARKKRLAKSLKELEARLKSGDILPKAKPDPATDAEIERMVFERDMLRKEINDEIRAAKPLTAWGKVGIGVDMVRLVMTSGEFSYALRQGGVYAFSHPLKWSSAMIESMKAFTSSRALYNLNKQIFNRKNAPKYTASGLVVLHEGMSLTRSEEVIMNYWMDKLPVFRNFNRAAIAFFNKTRTDMFDAGYETLSQNGEMTQTEQEVWANYINVMTGRGSLGVGRMSLEPSALLLNRTFFSARYVASRFQFIGGIAKVPTMSIAGENKRAYRMIAKEYIRFATGLATVLGLGVLMGADIETDPRSTDFLRPKFGNRRPDILMGFGQTITYLSRLLTGVTKTGSGRMQVLRPKNVFFYGDKFYSKDATTTYGGQDIESVFGRFLRSKLSPQFGLVVNIMTGENYLGEDITLLNTTSQLGYPMAYGDIFDVMQEDGIPTDVALSLLVLLGMGLQTYDNKGKGSSDGTKGGF